MKYAITILFSVTSLFFSCAKNNMVTNTGSSLKSESFDENDTVKSQIKITVGNKIFEATLYDNEAAKAFKALLPLTIRMDDFGGNEKKFDFSTKFPSDNYNPENIAKGDLMIWSGNTLVLFYKSFPTKYSYTKLGKIDDSSGIEKAVGEGSVMIKFELK